MSSSQPWLFNTFLYIFFFSPNTVAVVLLKNNKEGYEQPIAFFSQVLRDAQLKNNILEKQSYSLVKVLNAFRVHVLH